MPLKYFHSLGNDSFNDCECMQMGVIMQFRYQTVDLLWDLLGLHQKTGMECVFFMRCMEDENIFIVFCCMTKVHGSNEHEGSETNCCFDRMSPRPSPNAVLIKYLFYVMLQSL